MIWEKTLLRKGENTGYQQLLFFRKCLQKASILASLELVMVRLGLKNWRDQVGQKMRSEITFS